MAKIKNTHTKAINVKLTPEQWQNLADIRKASGKNISTLIRQNLDFFTHYYEIEKKFPNYQ
jgi:hypothetical protein